MDIINEFLNIEILLGPKTYNRIKKLKDNELTHLLNNIKKFKTINNKLILLNNHFLDLFLNHPLDEIINNYKDFDFISCYISNEELPKSQSDFYNNTYITEENVDASKIKNNELKAEENVEDEFIGEILDEMDYNYNPYNDTVETENKEDNTNIATNIATNTHNTAPTDIEQKEEIQKLETPKNTLDERLLKLEKERIHRINKIKSIKNSVFNKINYVAKDIDSQIHIYDKWDISGKSTCEGSLNDFIGYFNDRYSKIKAMIERKINKKAYPLSKIQRMKNEKDVFVVGIVTDMNTTKKGHKRVVIEDDEAIFSVIIMKDKIEKGELPDDILLDEVIGFEGAISQDGGVMFPNNCIRPDITPKPPKSIDEKIYTAFLSDVHIGSYEFLEDSFKKFIELLNGDTKNGLEEKIVSRLKYISIAGDLVDGVGIYPGQEYDLYDVDIISQYKEVATYIEQIPEHIDVIISPGNHDALRPAEPQPIFPKRILDLFDGLNNVHFVSNPGFVNIHGLDFLLYHGRSFDDVIGQISSASYQDPTSIMKELLKRRHLCPTYGGRCPIAPEKEDYLVIHNEPDIFHTGHIHINGYGAYKGTTLINSGTFQEQTDFQKRMGIHPTPARIPIIDMSKNGSQYIEWDNGKIKVI
ncbi:DNA-directed DNA polymerase [Methanococcus aeolicus Nankai-3]|uniref:DNA polymerase II small subunit n=1 Tax=Methanococcus aeolicus (strain ATCC BAA-1280 / DSM 17508 / OCM 812 / Nankai-3) TaxID=419665 RepID=A6UW71_META3|nr:DNA-directed DNA polymerase II small subunit [Methanococcus aeolicus]ABR56743.1 DNA-directed DNA polymerase [Methanococcus aeolicus Nankai-3]